MGLWRLRQLVVHYVALPMEGLEIMAVCVMQPHSHGRALSFFHVIPKKRHVCSIVKVHVVASRSMRRYFSTMDNTSVQYRVDVTFYVSSVSRCYWEMCTCAKSVDVTAVSLKRLETAKRKENNSCLLFGCCYIMYVAQALSSCDVEATNSFVCRA